MKGFRKQFIDLFDLSPEIILDLPLIMMVGQQSLYLENHKGISLYQADKIKLRVKNGYLVITGSDLTIEEFKSDDLFISGQIQEIFYDQG